MKGVYPPMTDVTDVNSTARSHDQVLLASGDDFGMVKLFNYPVSVGIKIDDLRTCDYSK